MNAAQRRHHHAVAVAVIEATGPYIDRMVGEIQNPKILKLILRQETTMLNGRPRRRMARAIARRLAELKQIGLRTCLACGCTDRHGCPGGCSWESLPEDNRQYCSQCFTAF